MKTRITQLLGIEHPIFQAAMSWASSNAPLVIAVSNAGGLGVLAAGPMRDKLSSLKQAALEGDVEWGKVEAGQSAGLVEEILPAAEVMRRLVAELEQARQRLIAL